MVGQPCLEESFCQVQLADVMQQQHLHMCESVVKAVT